MTAPKRAVGHKRPKWLEDAARSNHLRLAAPVMLAALYEVERAMLEYWPDKPTLELVRAAIAKAEGTS